MGLTDRNGSRTALGPCFSPLQLCRVVPPEVCLNMNTVATSIVVFGSTFGGALLGMYIRTRLPDHHLGEKTAEVVRLGMALMGTMTAMLLGLQLDSAKDHFNAVSDKLSEASGNIILLDRTLAHYGPEAQPIRKVLKVNTERVLEEVWPSAPNRRPTTLENVGKEEALYAFLQTLGTLTPPTEAQKSLKSHAIDLAFTTGQIRWLITAQQANTAPVAIIVVLVCWLTIIFTSFGLFAPRNTTVTVSFLLCAASIAAAVFLLLELYTPFSGVIRVSSAPLRTAVALIGR